MEATGKAAGKPGKGLKILLRFCANFSHDRWVMNSLRRRVPGGHRIFQLYAKSWRLKQGRLAMKCINPSQ